MKSCTTFDRLGFLSSRKKEMYLLKRPNRLSKFAAGSKLLPLQKRFNYAVGGNDDDDDNEGHEASKSYETEIFSLRSLLRSELNYDCFLQLLKDEQQRVVGAFTTSARQ
ncbi:hypothetical protein BDB00DRAFT_934561, partial [Zychaea mexicana]|uniref:uncharacterized protein n=1 Tax=Zychaea mexicana TaxID=64656 RepID=UPI0022FDFFDD